MIRKNDSWQLVHKLDHRKVIGPKWVYKTKLNSNGLINKHKARIGVKGYAQEADVDYIDTFAPRDVNEAGQGQGQGIAPCPPSYG